MKGRQVAGTKKQWVNNKAFQTQPPQLLIRGGDKLRVLSEAN